MPSAPTALDWATWGAPFQSTIEYLRFNWVEGGAARFGVSGPGYYPGHLVASLGALGVIAPVLALVGARRAWPIALMVLAFVGAHSVVGHKELRFILPVLPLLGVSTALGVDVLREWRRSAGWGASLLVVLTLLVQPKVTSLTWSALGIEHLDGHLAVFDDGGPENRLLARAGRSPEVCGVELLSREVDSSAGYAALHRDIPLFDATHPPASSEEVNAFIGRRGAIVGPELAVDGEFALVLVRPECTPARDFTARLR